MKKKEINEVTITDFTVKLLIVPTQVLIDSLMSVVLSSNTRGSAAITGLFEGFYLQDSSEYCPR